LTARFLALSCCRYDWIGSGIYDYSLMRPGKHSNIVVKTLERTTIVLILTFDYSEHVP